MKPDEAIETLELNRKAREALGSDALNTPLLVAQQLGIEALELFAVLREMARHPRYKSYREDIANKIRCLLPSETGEHNE